MNDRVNKVNCELTLRRYVVPSHGCPNHGLKQPLKEDTGCPQCTSVLGDDAGDVHEGRTQTDCSVDPNIEERIILGARPVEFDRARVSSSMVLISLEVGGNVGVVQRYLMLWCQVRVKHIWRRGSTAVAIRLAPDL